MYSGIEVMVNEYKAGKLAAWIVSVSHDHSWTFFLLAKLR